MVVCTFQTRPRRNQGKRHIRGQHAVGSARKTTPAPTKCMDVCFLLTKIGSWPLGTKQRWRHQPPYISRCAANDKCCANCCSSHRARTLSTKSSQIKPNEAINHIIVARDDKRLTCIMPSIEILSTSEDLFIPLQRSSEPADGGRRTT